MHALSWEMRNLWRKQPNLARFPKMAAPPGQKGARGVFLHESLVLVAALGARDRGNDVAMGSASCRRAFPISTAHRESDMATVGSTHAADRGRPAHEVSPSIGNYTTVPHKVRWYVALRSAGNIESLISAAHSFMMFIVSDSPMTDTAWNPPCLQRLAFYT